MSEDRPLYEINLPPPAPVPTLAEIATMLRTLSKQILEVGSAMEYAGGFGHMGQRGRELLWSARIVRTWAQEIEGAQG